MSQCVISLGEITSFEWDICYVFRSTATRSDREAAMRVSDPGYRDLERQIVFLKTGKIVYQESGPTNPEHPIRDEVVFDMPPTVAFRSYSRGSSRFVVSQELDGNEPYYLLRAF
jgi:hypothetical protein